MIPIKHPDNSLWDFGQLQCFSYLHPSDLKKEKKKKKYHKLTPFTNAKPSRFTESCCRDTEAAFLLGSPTSWEKRTKTSRFNMKKKRKKPKKDVLNWERSQKSFGFKPLA